MLGNNAANLKKISMRTALVALLGLAGSAAWATTAHGSASNLRYTLVDLTPDDGVAASLTWVANPDQRFGSAFAYVNNVPTYSANSDGTTDIAEEWHRGADTVTAGVKNSADFAAVSLAGSTFTSPSDGTANDLRLIAYSGEYYFNVGAGTAVTFHVDYDLSTDTVASGVIANASSAANLVVSGEYSPGQWGYYANEYDYTGGSGYWDGHVQGTLQHTFVNAGSSGLLGEVWVSLNMTSDAPLLAVPEPSTYAMLLAGLGLVGLARRRNAPKRG